MNALPSQRVSSTPIRCIGYDVSDSLMLREVVGAAS